MPVVSGGRNVDHHDVKPAPFKPTRVCSACLGGLLTLSAGCAGTGSEVEDYLSATGRRFVAIQDRAESMLFDRPTRSLRQLTANSRLAQDEIENELRGIGSIQQRTLMLGDREVRRLGRIRENALQGIERTERDLARLAADVRDPARYRLDPEDEFARLSRAIERMPKIFRLDHRPFPEISDPDAATEIDPEIQRKSLIGRILRRLKP